jgi:hypothetical protein
MAGSVGCSEVPDLIMTWLVYYMDGGIGFKQ